MTRLDLVIVHRDQPWLVPETVWAFLGQGVPMRIVVVDNSSSPEALEKLYAELGDCEDVVILPQDRNLGFGPGANAGFRWFLEHPDPGATWLAVAPHDARPHPDCVVTMLKELGRRPRAGLASADVGDGCTPVVDRYFGAILEPARVMSGWEPAGYPHGTLLLARRDCLADIGLFDERYFAYVEESDLALRARTRGWEVGVVRGAEVRNATIGSRAAIVDYLQLRNTLLLTREHYGRYALFIRMVVALWHLGAGSLSERCRGQDPFWDPQARLLALRDFALARFGPPPPSLTRPNP